MLFQKCEVGCPKRGSEIVELPQTDKQQHEYAILREIMEGLNLVMRKKDGSVFFQAFVSSESWDVLAGAKQHTS